MIAVVDYGAGNLMSVRNALSFLGIENCVAESASSLEKAEGVILPGVGEFGTATGELKKRGLDGALKECAAAGKPLLGICLGMQLLFEESEESPGVRGLALLPGRSRRFSKQFGLKVPHMGWNSVASAKNSRIFPDAPAYMYFVHSYWIEADDARDISATCRYGNVFTAAAERGAIFGCQFHPEKSGNSGLSILKKFNGLTKGEN